MTDCRYSFWREPEEHERFLALWRDLQEFPADGARLRRCASPVEVMVQPPFYRLRGLLLKWNNQALATALGVCSHVRNHDTKYSFASQLGGAHLPKDKRPVLSELRFGRLQGCQDWDQLYTQLRRAVQMLDKSANVVSLADFCRGWSFHFKSMETGLPADAGGVLYRLADGYFSSFVKM